MLPLICTHTWAHQGVNEWSLTNYCDIIASSHGPWMLLERKKPLFQNQVISYRLSVFVIPHSWVKVNFHSKNVKTSTSLLLVTSQIYELKFSELELSLSLHKGILNHLVKLAFQKLRVQVSFQAVDLQLKRDSGNTVFP